MNKVVGIFVNIGDEEKRKKFGKKAYWDKGSMNNVIVEWIDSYLNNDLLTKNDAVMFFSLIIDDLIRAGKISGNVFELHKDIEEMLDQKMKKTSLSDLRSYKGELMGKRVKTMGEVLKQIRIEKNLTLRAVAERVSKILNKSYSWQNISRIENSTGVSKDETIMPLLELYGITMEEFKRKLGGKDDDSLGE